LPGFTNLGIPAGTLLQPLVPRCTPRIPRQRTVRMPVYTVWTYRVQFAEDPVGENCLANGSSTQRSLPWAGLAGAVPRVAREPPGCHDSVGRVPVGDRSPVKARPDPCAAVAGSGCVLLCCAADTIMRTRQRLDALLLEMQLDPADADQVNVIMNTQEAALEMVRPGVT
jgi:hypothetical protein